MCAERGYHYIHPHFRGPNNNPDACGSDLVLSDIDDAIAYALENVRVDTNNIHVIGTSGGGYATLLTYMRSQHRIRSFSAYVPISNLIDWYYESLGRDARYARDIALATSGTETSIDIEEAKKRSPIFMPTPVGRRARSKLSIYCGIDDGYTGSVPIAHSLRMYNKVVRDLDPANISDLISEAEMEQLLRQRNTGPQETGRQFSGRDVVFSRRYQDKVQVLIFDGGHEMPPAQALDHIPSRNLLAIGDSNGAAAHGWVNQLRDLCFSDLIVNTAVSGNTIGFDNLDREQLNTLRNIDAYIERGVDEMGRIDAIVISLGTNDCKAVFADQLPEVPRNLDRLLTAIKENAHFTDQFPRVYVVSPPPYGPEEKLIEKYRGAGERLARLAPELEKITRRHGFVFINTYQKLLPIIDYLSVDGVHLTVEGQKLTALMIEEALVP
jgi:lysophospholipase L1-like esterase